MQRVLEGIINNGRIASAYIFLGPPGSAKLAAAEEFADRLGCAKVDRRVVSPDGASVKIEQILQLQHDTRFGPAAGPRLLAIVEQADEMTPEAAAAFLKTLEEPAPAVTFVLLVEREDRLPRTIVSRCQRIIFQEELKEWRPDPQLAGWYEELRSLGKKNVIDLFDLSTRLEKEKERIEELLYELILFAKNELGNIRLARTMLEAVKYIKRKANLRLTLDVMCLKLSEL